MSDCCSVEQSGEGRATIFSDKSAMSRCTKCGAEGRAVERQTILHHVEHEHLGRVSDEAYLFCPDPSCNVVYYGDSGTRFTVNDLRELVSAKTTGDARPICYCFGFTEGDAREEIVHTGKSTISATVSALIKTSMCACEVRNPSGACCLGEVNRTVKRLLDEHETSIKETPAADHDCWPR